LRDIFRTPSNTEVNFQSKSLFFIRSITVGATLNNCTITVAPTHSPLVNKMEGAQMEQRYPCKNSKPSIVPIRVTQKRISEKTST
jgi:hypothetical protein